MKILIIQTAFIGDVILATALPESIAAVWPEAQIDFLVRKGNESLLEGNPHLQNVWVWHKKKGKYSQLLQLRRQLQKEAYEVVINLQRFGSTGWLAISIGAQTVIGYAKNPLSFFFKHRLPHEIDPEAERPLHETERNHSLLSPLGNFPLKKPRLYPSKNDFEKIQALTGKEKYICMAPASVWFTKQWPKHKWIELINSLSARLKTSLSTGLKTGLSANTEKAAETIFLLGAAADRPLCTEIAEASEHPKVRNLAGELSLLQSAALMAGASMNYVNDSAPLHLCSAMNAPVTAIFCSTVPAFGFGPLSDKSVIAQTQEKLPCRPCGLHGKSSCPKGHFRCAEILITK